jgi:TonB-linked SusC/RagA family outer membrane protein
LNENYFTINKSFGEDHVVNLLAGFSVQKTSNRFSTLTGQNFVNDVLENENLATAGTMLVSNDLQRFGLQSWYGRANYAFKNKYLLTLTARADGSTKFGADNKWAYFPSGAVAWKIHEEEFLKASNLVSDAKLRVSYGLTGNQGIAPYQTLDRFGSYKYFTGSAFQTGFGPGLASANDEQGRTIVTGLGNAKLKWETTKSFDVGFDLGIMDNRFTLTADYYIKNTYDLLRLKTINPSTGFDRQWINDGEISNRGIELALGADVISNSNFTWNVGVNFTMNENKVVSMGESDRVLIGSIYESVRQQISSFTVDETMYAFYGYKTDGIIQSLEEGIEAGLTGRDAEPGEIRYLDISGPDGTPDGVVNELDRTIIGNPNPDFIYSINSSMRYKQFDLSAQLYGVQGNDVFDFQKMTPSRQILRWTLDNPSNEYPRANNSRGYRASDFFITDGSFLRVQNVTLGYNIKQGTIKGVETLRVYLSANNLYTFTKFNTGFDPEMGENGINGGAYPRPRAFSIGLNIGF